MADKNNIRIEDVIDVKELQNLQDNWAKATNLAFVLRQCGLQWNAHNKVQ